MTKHFFPRADFRNSFMIGIDEYLSSTVWPDWAIYCSFGNFSKPVATIILPKSCHNFEAIFVKVLKSFIFLVTSFLGNFFRYLATFYWSHCSSTWPAFRENSPVVDVIKLSFRGNLNLTQIKLIEKKFFQMPETCITMWKQCCFNTKAVTSL